MENGMAITARANALQFECKKDALKQVQSGDVKVTFTINPDDMPNELYADVMGQRYMCVIVAINDDETPKEKPKSFAQQAVMLSHDEDFWNFLNNTRGEFIVNALKADTYIKEYCGIRSKAELVAGSTAGDRFKALQRDFQYWKNN